MEFSQNRIRKFLIESSGLKIVSKSFILLLIFVSQMFYIPLNVSDESPVEAHGRERQVEAGLPRPQPEVPRDHTFDAHLHLSFKKSLKFHLIIFKPGFMVASSATNALPKVKQLYVTCLSSEGLITKFT